MKPSINTRKILRKIYGALSFSTALFVFQACYGTMQDLYTDVVVEGIVKSRVTNLPIKGIKVFVDTLLNRKITDSTGKFSIYALAKEKYYIKAMDIDSTENGLYIDKDTTIFTNNSSINVEILLDEK